MKKFTALALATAMMSPTLFANQASSASSESVETVAPTVVMSAIDTVQEQINNWKDSDEGDRWIELGELCGPDEPCVQLFEGVDSVKGRPGTAEFASTRALAFQSALLNAQTDQAVSQFMDNAVNVVANLDVNPVKFDQQICEASDPQDKVQMLAEKALILADQWLSNQMKEQGVPDEEIPKKLAKMETEQRLNTLYDAIEQSSSMSAQGNSSGYIVLKNFEAIDHNGQAAIGVVLASAPKIIQLLNTMKSAKGNFDPAAYDSIGALLKVSGSINRYVRNDLAESFGARLIYNQNGFPTVIGIGQAGKLAVSNDPAENAVQTKVAKESADQAARNAITQMFNTQVKAKVEQSEKAAFAKAAIAQYVGCELTEVDESQSGELSYSKFLKTEKVSDSRVKIKGMKLVRRSSYVHPALKKKVYYTAYQWSPVTENAARTHEQAFSKKLEKKVVTPVQSHQSEGTRAVKPAGTYTSESKPSMVPDF
ncbi:hypothetical protein EOPP23_13430 [Endozoicomonas sp. OPT23]|uniref:DUF6844 domain-containing protein n=1 Tax=Endozoicomonas sp. OPT23 TaxID=2072845 RepID=UPI00129A1599|nr:hypothetical protein [Endozoicomonas sp. OPT23]MRI33992.1 hypothetical protein [Endozoicomonas sp. OPT23]